MNDRALLLIQLLRGDLHRNVVKGGTAAVGKYTDVRPVDGVPNPKAQRLAVIDVHHYDLIFTDELHMMRFAGGEVEAGVGCRLVFGELRDLVALVMQKPSSRIQTQRGIGAVRCAERKGAGEGTIRITTPENSG